MTPVEDGSQIKMIVLEIHLFAYKTKKPESRDHVI
jgi:hypothetical protein